MKRATATVAVVALAATTLTLATDSAGAAPTRRTDYAFAGRAYGSLAKAEPLAAGSGPTAPAWLGCTRLTGTRRHNAVTSTGGEADAALRVTGVGNTMRSYRTRRQVGTLSRSRVAEAVLGDPTGPTLTFENLRTTSRAFARRGSGRLGAVGSTRVASLVADTGTPLDVALNSVDDGFRTLVAMIRDSGGTLPVPGFGELSLGETVTRVRRHSAVGRTSALRARLYGANGIPGGNDDVRVVLARSRAVIHDDVPSGIFQGRAVPLRSTLAGGLVNIGRVIARPLPCPGTRGDVRGSSLADVDLGGAGVIEVDGLTSRVFGVQRPNRSARAWTASRIAHVSLGGGQVQLTGIVGRADVRTDRRGRVVRNGVGRSRIGRLVIDGETQQPPSPGDVVEVPGVATLEFFVRSRSARGSRVTAVRATLLPGTPGESVVDLGQARTVIRRQ